MAPLAFSPPWLDKGLALRDADARLAEMAKTMNASRGRRSVERLGGPFVWFF